jgi:hypothetical protein
MDLTGVGQAPAGFGPIPIGLFFTPLLGTSIERRDVQEDHWPEAETAKTASASP